MADTTYTAHPSGTLFAGFSTLSYPNANIEANVLLYQNEGYCYAGQEYQHVAQAAPRKTFWFRFRHILCFDTNNYESQGRLEDVKLRIYVHVYGFANDYLLKVCTSSGTTGLCISPTNPPEYADWDSGCSYCVASGSMSELSLGWNEFNIPRNVINKNGWTNIKLLTNREDNDQMIGGGENNVDESVVIRGESYSNSSYRPQLILTFSDLDLNLGWLRMIDMSFVKFVQDAIAGSDYLSGVTVIDGYPNKHEDILDKLPVISIQHSRVQHTPVGLSYGTYLKEIPYSIDVFARNKGERDDIVDWIVDNLLHRKFTVWDFNYSIENPAVLGSTMINELTNVFLQPMEIYPGVIDAHHATLFFDTSTVVNF